jgi:3-hydroxyacyl-CoA dehydrogenase
VKEVAARLKAENHPVPQVVTDLLQAGFSGFYEGDKVYNPVLKQMVDASPKASDELSIAAICVSKSARLENNSAALLDMGNSVALFQFKTKNATLNSELILSLEESLGIVEREFDALVIGHDGENFAYGADLMEAITAHTSGNIQKVIETVVNFQRTAVALKYAPFPVVVAPFGRTLGGGAEFVLYSDKIVAHHELYIGLVEVGVGLIPAGGGTTELVRRAMQNLPDDADALPFIREVFKTIGMAKVSESAEMARKMGFLQQGDIVVMNRYQQLSVAKSQARAMADAGYQPPHKTPVPVLGDKSLGVMKTMLYVMHESGYATDYDKVVGERVAFVMAGGNLSEPTKVSEDYLLKLEREAIFECLADPRTHARIEYMLKTGKPLRN